MSCCVTFSLYPTESTANKKLSKAEACTRGSARYKGHRNVRPAAGELRSFPERRVYSSYPAHNQPKIGPSREFPDLYERPAFF